MENQTLTMPFVAVSQKLLPGTENSAYRETVLSRLLLAAGKKCECELWQQSKIDPLVVERVRDFVNRATACLGSRQFSYKKANITVRDAVGYCELTPLKDDEDCQKCGKQQQPNANR